MTGVAGDYARWLRDRWRIRRASVPTQSAATVVIFAFHGLFRDVREAASGACDPQQAITIDFFREFVESLLGYGVAIRDLHAAITCPQPGLTAAITFDDGYFNNVRALDILEGCGVPATFFISTSHVDEGKSFWWDALYRNARKTGTGTSVIASQIRRLKPLRNDQIEAQLRQWFGPTALTPVSDCDRPFTPAELATLAGSPQATLGNHTSDHGILTNYDPTGAREQIVRAQEYLTRVTGTAPKVIAYPNGNCDRRVVEIAREAGLELGVTVRAGANQAPVARPFELRRLTIRKVPAAGRQARGVASVARRAI
jgi:peptidoglycan/xylan/chitin deacetylase (PgdA/CDA1 family)